MLRQPKEHQDAAGHRHQQTTHDRRPTIRIQRQTGTIPHLGHAPHVTTSPQTPTTNNPIQQNRHYTQATKNKAQHPNTPPNTATQPTRPRPGMVRTPPTTPTPRVGGTHTQRRNHQPSREQQATAQGHRRWQETRGGPHPHPRPPWNHTRPQKQEGEHPTPDPTIEQQKPSRRLHNRTHTSTSSPTIADIPERSETQPPACDHSKRDNPTTHL